MPTVLRIGSYRFFFYSNEKGEPVHIHVQRDRSLAKFWLKPIGLAQSKRFTPHELHEIYKHIQQHEKLFLEAWYEHLGS